METKLINGMIPKRRYCPYFSRCSQRKPNCPSKENGTLPVRHSCGLARMFESRDERLKSSEGMVSMPSEIKTAQNAPMAQGAASPVSFAELVAVKYG